MEIDTKNKFGVAVNGERILILMPPAHMTKKEALNLAAWLVALADYEGDEFQATLDAVMST